MQREMRVRVRLFGDLIKFLPEGTTGRTATVELPEGSTAFDLLLRLGIPHQAHEGCVAMSVGDQVIEHSQALGEDDVVSIFPPLAGGV